MSLVILDLDNTLVNRVAAFRLWGQNFLKELNFDASYLDLLEELDQDGFVDREFFAKEVVNKLNLNINADELLAHYISNYPKSFTLDPNVKSDLLRMSKKGFRLAIATNGKHYQEDVILNCGLDKLVEGWFISDVVGFRKPDKRLAFKLLEELNIFDNEGYMIGDSNDDVEFAQNINFNSIWLSRNRKWDEKRKSPDFLAFTFSEAVDWVINHRQIL